VTTVDNGIVTVASRRSVDDTVAQLERMLHANGVKIFAVVDHSGEAAAAGLVMRPTKLVVFGNPKAGTPLMVAAPSIALDLPLKLLVWADADGRVWMSFNAPDYLAARHALPSELLAPLNGVQTLVTKLNE
jgi:uncharacterized protein (DUF302 family)